jgi:hypothetical protein
MIENKPNRASVRLSPRILDWLNDQQYALRKSGRQKHTYAELLEKVIFSGEQSSMIQHLTGSNKDPEDADTISVKTPYAPEHMARHEKLERILTHGTEKQIGGIDSNLDAFCAEIRLSELEGGSRPMMSRENAG